MSYLRSLLFIVILVIATPPLSLFILLCAPLSHQRRRRSAMPWVNMTIWLIEHLLRIDYRVVGRENIPDGPVVILCKHQSAWETIVLQAVFPLVLFVWKKELRWQIPFFGWALAVIPMIAIDRSGGRHALKQLVEQGRMRLSQGYPIVIFPEGTRAKPGQHTPYQNGGAFLAVKAGVPVLPVALNSGEVWGRNALLKRPGTVTVSIGPLIESAGLKADNLTAQVETWIETEMQRISPHRYKGKNENHTQSPANATA